jgi:general secretion pathway protein C
VGDLVLLGPAVGSFRETFALVLKNSSHEERVFRLGDTVFSTGELVSVKKDVAEILVGGKRVKILTPNAIAEAGASQPAPAQPAAGGLASSTGAGNYVVDQRALNAALDNIGQAMTDARLLPSVKDGKVEGFRASEVKPQGIFGTIGIKNGDILLRINDFPIDSPEKAIQSFASLKGQSRIKLDLVRDGQPTTFNYDIR